MNHKGFEDLSGVIYSNDTSEPEEIDLDNSKIDKTWCNYVGYGNMATVNTKNNLNLSITERNRIQKLCLCSDTPVDRSMAWTTKDDVCSGQKQCQNSAWNTQTTGYTTYPNMRIGGQCKATTYDCSKSLHNQLCKEQSIVLNTIKNVNDGDAIKLALLYSKPTRMVKKVVQQEQSKQDVNNPLSVTKFYNK